MTARALILLACVLAIAIVPTYGDAITERGLEGVRDAEAAFSAEEQMIIDRIQADPEAMAMLAKYIHEMHYNGTLKGGIPPLGSVKCWICQHAMEILAPKLEHFKCGLIFKSIAVAVCTKVGFGPYIVECAAVMLGTCDKLYHWILDKVGVDGLCDRIHWCSNSTLALPQH